MPIFCHDGHVCYSYRGTTVPESSHNMRGKVHCGIAGEPVRKALDLFICVDMSIRKVSNSLLTRCTALSYAACDSSTAQSSSENYVQLNTLKVT